MELRKKVLKWTFYTLAIIVAVTAAVLWIYWGWWLNLLQPFYTNSAQSEIITILKFIGCTFVSLVIFFTSFIFLKISQLYK